MLSNSSSAPFVNASSIARCSRRVSSPIASSSNSLRFSFSLYSPPGGRNGSSCVLNILRMKKIKSMAELVEDKEPVCKSGRQEMILDKLGYSRTFADVEEEVAELLSGIKKEAEAGRLPSNAAAGLMELYKNYKNAVLKSGNPRAEKIVISNMATAFDLIMKDVEVSFDFPSYHKAIREPFDYYKFGQNYIRPLIDFRKSYVGNISVFSDIEDKLQQGHNVVLISNHQTEADPAIIALSLETTNRHISENLIYVAGDRVLSDPLCKPFSMGRNLFCVYSKKHMNDDPELAETKRKANTRTLKEMATAFRGGSQIVWIAPSGGRDRPDPSTGEWFPAPFDASSVDNMRRLAEHSGVPVHIYPMALIGYDIMPPPLQVEKEIGEQRVISFHGTGISVAPELNFKDITAGCENPEEAKRVYSDTLYRSVTEQYSVLRSAIHGNQGLKASSSTVSLSQPWRT